MNNFNFNIQDILRFIPHRYPFVLVDRVLDYENCRFLRAIKNITANDPFLQGHFPGCYIFPGVLILESIAQSGVILMLINHPEYQKRNGFFCITGMDSVRFKKFVTPGDQLIVNINLVQERKNMFFFDGIVFSKNQIVCFAKIICSYVSNIESILNKK